MFRSVYPKTVAEIVKILTEANKVSFIPARSSGCGRACVVMFDLVDKDMASKVAQACEVVVLTYLENAFGTSGIAIYIGRDNADGRALGKSEAFAKVLNERGLRCYADVVDDCR